MRKSISDRLHGGQFVQYDEEGLQIRKEWALGQELASLLVFSSPLTCSIPYGTKTSSIYRSSSYRHSHPTCSHCFSRDKRAHKFGFAVIALSSSDLASCPHKLATSFAIHD